MYFCIFVFLYFCIFVFLNTQQALYIEREMIFTFQVVTYIIFYSLLYKFIRDINKSLLLVFAIFSPLFVIYPIAEVEVFFLLNHRGVSSYRGLQWGQLRVGAWFTFGYGDSPYDCRHHCLSSFYFLSSFTTHQISTTHTFTSSSIHL